MDIKIVIGGYYGFDSIGDDAMLSIIISNMKKLCPNCKITVLCASPARMATKYGVECINRFDPTAVIRAMSGAHLYISGGGSLLQDGTSMRSLLYYSSLIKLAKALGTKVYIYANGIGPLSKSKAAAGALKSADRISVRDPDSLCALKNMGIEEKKAHLTADPIFLEKEISEKEAQNILKKYSLKENEYFTVSLRCCKGRRQINEKALIASFKNLTRAGLTPVFISMQDAYDLRLCSRVAANFGARVITGISATTLIGIQSKARLAVGMRLHFLLCAVVSGTPVTPLSYDCKVDNVMTYLGESTPLDAFNFTEKELSNELFRALNEKSYMRKARKSKAADFAALAASDAAAAAELATDTAVI